ncbi:MAG: cytochrome C [Gammaproteobacteria bacterium]|nr:cytochrome C [Gammaproteobacteria bacterium]MCP4089851.1 cytochrome C [Gammaproteobacteria bacterium]MCP4275506.1 cytochrome C [Gammaproteobacteria bacterium]MCP4832998.1 cytochrome C [Gammaproteobacteria bacterium]MCP4928630.1 cytochrome C [Gammaproteobacteria bacterium]
MQKIFLRIVAVLIVGLALGAVALVSLFPLQRPAADISVAMTPENIERGRYLAINVFQCVDCHSERDWTLYGGPPLAPVGAGRSCMTQATQTAGVNSGQESFPGKLCIRNITPDNLTGIGQWTDGEIIRAVREGVDHNGQGLFPIMPYFIYRHVSDEDMEAVVAYLRSVEPVVSDFPERQIDFPFNLMVKMWPEPLDGPVFAPDPSDRIAYGEYLATVARCEFCHTPKDPSSMEGFEGRRFAGGMPFFLNGRVMYPMNLTPHNSGLGAWSKEQFINLFKRRSQPVSVPKNANTVMNWNAFSGMTEEDLGALYDFFMTLPPVPFEKEPI